CLCQRGNMHRIWLGGIIILVAGIAAPLAALCADVETQVAAPELHAVRHARAHIASTCQSVWTCGPLACGWRQVCRLRCPDRYSCAPLYGAYGPYSGAGYWGAYTSSGWGSYR